MVCAPSYLASLSHSIDSPKDLERCEFISISILQDSLTFIKDSQSVLVKPSRIRLEVNSINAAREALIEGLGVQRLPYSAVQADLETGKLIQLVPDWQLPETGVYAVWPSAGLRKRLTEKLVTALIEYEATA